MAFGNLFYSMLHGARNAIFFGGYVCVSEVTESLTRGIIVFGIN